MDLLKELNLSHCIVRADVRTFANGISEDMPHTSDIIASLKGAVQRKIDERINESIIVTAQPDPLFDRMSTSIKMVIMTDDELNRLVKHLTSK